MKIDGIQTGLLILFIVVNSYKVESAQNDFNKQNLNKYK